MIYSHSEYRMCVSFYQLRDRSNISNVSYFDGIDAANVNVSSQKMFDHYYTSGE